MIDYNKGIHPDSGKILSLEKDIIITPFFTEEFCNELIEICKFYKDRFEYDPIHDPYPNWELHIADLSRFMFLDYINHFNSKISPMLKEVFLKDVVTGFYSPFINRYTMDSQRSSPLHNDTTMISMVIKLNNDYTGGELEFPRQKFNNIEVPPGHAVIFPGTVSHPHRVNDLTNGTKYSFVGWTWPDTWVDHKGQSSQGDPSKPHFKQPKLI